MKKIIIVFILLLILTGCSNVKDTSYEDILKTVSAPSSASNVYRTGYKYYLPRGLEVDDSKLFNEVITSNKSVYYLYIDAVSYYNKVNNPYKENPNSFYSKILSNDDKYGYVEINLTLNNKYLIEIMYNYAKIEVIVDKDDINLSLLNAINILKSIKLNDDIIANLLGKDILNFAEEEYNIFNTVTSDSNYIKIDDSYEIEEDVVPDTDLIN